MKRRAALLAVLVAAVTGANCLAAGTIPASGPGTRPS
jgi:hypothetical protein